MSETWRAKQRDGLARRTEQAQGLVGKTIAHAAVVPHMEECDAQNVLALTMTDGSEWHVTGFYGDYTGHSCDEYVEFIEVTAKGHS